MRYLTQFPRQKYDSSLPPLLLRMRHLASQPRLVLGAAHCFPPCPIQLITKSWQFCSTKLFSPFSLLHPCATVLIQGTPKIPLSWTTCFLSKHARAPASCPPSPSSTVLPVIFPKCTKDHVARLKIWKTFPTSNRIESHQGRVCSLEGKCPTFSTWQNPPHP